MLKLFNTLSQKKEILDSASSSPIRIFICGPTLYDYTHLGHARIFLTFDLLARFLKSQGTKIDVLVNMTDINQNVFNKAIDKKIDYMVLTNFYYKEFLVDLNLLNIHTITRLARVSDYVNDIGDLIEILLNNKFAYWANGNIYFDTVQVKNYGKISRQTENQLKLHPLDVGPNKKNPQDFMMWNSSDNFGFSWLFNFGIGVPWWHIQDTAVAWKNFGSIYEVHGGASELSFPHHEAHRAQYEALTGIEDPVKFWFYTGLVLADGEKMSKSLQNMVLIRDIIKKYGQNLIRLYLFSTHYKDDINYNEKDLAATGRLLKKIIQTRDISSSNTSQKISSLLDDFMGCLNDDLNSPRAIENLEKICDLINHNESISEQDLYKILEILGIQI